MIKLNDLSKAYDADVTTYKNAFNDDLFVVSLNCDINSQEDLIMLLREEILDTGCLEFGADYQFQDFYITGSDLIDLCKAYNM